MYNPQNIDFNELRLINDYITATEIIIIDVEARKAACIYPMARKELDDYIQKKKADLERFKQERQHILYRGYEY